MALKLLDFLINCMVFLNQCVIFPVVIILLHGRDGILSNQFFTQSFSNLHLISQWIEIRVDGTCIHTPIPLIRESRYGLKKTTSWYFSRSDTKCHINVHLWTSRYIAKSCAGTHLCCIRSYCYNTRYNRRRPLKENGLRLLWYLSLNLKITTSSCIFSTGPDYWYMIYQILIDNNKKIKFSNLILIKDIPHNSVFIEWTYEPSYSLLSCTFYLPNLLLIENFKYDC